MALALPSTIVMPVSGQAFISQLGISLALTEAGYRPRLALGASGGALVAAQGIRNNWASAQWEAEVLQMTDTAALQKHWMGELQALIEPSVYTFGSGLQKYYDVITSGSLKQFRSQELIINAYNTTTGRTVLFSTMAADRSVLTGGAGPLALLGVAPEVHYLGDLPDDEYRRKLKSVLEATSAVPVVFDRVPVGTDLYADGGVSFTSPLTAVNAIKPIKEVLYINPFDINIAMPATYGNAMQNIVAFTSQVALSNAIQDRFTYLSSLTCGDFTQLGIISGVAPSATFATDLTRTAGRPRLVELFPTQVSYVPMTMNQTYAEYMTGLRAAKKEFGYRIFYAK